MRPLVLSATLALSVSITAYDPDAQCVGQPAPESYAFRRFTAPVSDGSCGAGCKTYTGADGGQVAVSFISWWYAVKVDGVWEERTGMYPGGISLTAWSPSSSGFYGIRVEMEQQFNPCTGAYGGGAGSLQYAEADLGQRTGWPSFTTDLFAAGANLGTPILDAIRSQIATNSNPYGRLRIMARVHSGSPNVAESEVPIEEDMSVSFNDALINGLAETMGTYCADNPESEYCTDAPEEPGGGGFDLADLFAGPDAEHVAALEAEQAELAQWSPAPLFERMAAGFVEGNQEPVFTAYYGGTIPITIDLTPYSDMLTFLKWVLGIQIVWAFIIRIRKDAEEAAA